MSVILSVLILSMLSGCGSRVKKIHEDDMKINLTNSFNKSFMENATWYYTSSDANAIGIKVLKSELEKNGVETNSVADYAVAYITANQIKGASEVQTAATEAGQDYVFFEYEHKAKDKEFSYLNCFYDNKDEYWIVSFACYKDAYQSFKNDFVKYAASVTFEN